MSFVPFDKTFGEIYLETCRTGGVLSPTSIQLLLKSIFVFGKDYQPLFPYDVPPPPEQDIGGESGVVQEEPDVVGIVPEDFAIIGSGLSLCRLNIEEIDFPRLLACFPKCSGALRISLFECTMRFSDLTLLYETVSGLQGLRFLMLDGVTAVPDDKEVESQESGLTRKRTEAFARFCSIPVAHLSLRFNSLGTDPNFGKIFAEPLWRNSSILSLDLTGNKIDDAIFHTLMLCLHHHPSLMSLSLAMNHLSGSICSFLDQEENDQDKEKKDQKNFGEFWILGSTVFENMDAFNEFREEYYSLLLGEDMGTALVEKLPTLESRKAKKPPSMTKDEELCSAWELEMAKQQADGTIEVRGNEKIVSFNLSSNALFCSTNWRDAIDAAKKIILEKKQLHRMVLERNTRVPMAMDLGHCGLEVPMEDENDLEDRLDAITSFIDDIDKLLAQRVSEAVKPQENE